MDFADTLATMTRTHIASGETLSMPITLQELETWKVDTVQEYVEKRTSQRPEWRYTLEA